MRSLSGLKTALVALLAVALVSCGSDGSSAADGTDPQTAEVDRAEKERIPTVEAPCRSATVSAGAQPEVIEFAVRCRASATAEKVTFSIARYSLQNRTSKPGIRHFSKRPRVSGPGALRPSGKCDRSGMPLYCQARANGRITVVGKLHVKPRSRCTMGVAVYVTESPRCEGTTCPATAAIETLSRGVPRGC
jgi:hypothetical protein